MFKLISLNIDGLDGDINTDGAKANTTITGIIIVIDRNTTQECCIVDFTATAAQTSDENSHAGVSELCLDFDKLKFEQDIIAEALKRWKRQIAEITKMADTGIHKDISDVVASFVKALVKSKGKINLVVYDTAFEKLADLTGSTLSVTAE